jgi:hypothetical protein
VAGKKILSGPEQFMRVVKEALYSLMRKPSIISAFYGMGYNSSHYYACKKKGVGGEPRRAGHGVVGIPGGSCPAKISKVASKLKF